MEIAVVSQIAAITSIIKSIKDNDDRLRKYKKRKKKIIISYLINFKIKSSPVCWKLPRSEDYFEKVLTWPDNHFHQVFRMSKSTFFEIVEKLSPILTKIYRSRKPISASERVAIGIYYLKSGSDYSCIADVFGKSKTSVCRIVDEFCFAIISKYYKNSFNFPKTIEAQTETANQFLFNWQYPNCIGAMDGTHIPIITPKENGADYYNYKKWHSILLLAVCDSNYKLTYINCGFPGKVSDGGAFACSKLGEYLKNDMNSDFAVIADAAFPILPNCMKPYPGDQLTEDEKNFNYRLSRARMPIEGTFGRIKGRWRALLKRCDAEVQKAIRIIITCCILHNIVEEKKEKFLPIWLEEVRNYSDVYPQPDQVFNDYQNGFEGLSSTNMAKAKRDAICELLRTTYPV